MTRLVSRLIDRVHKRNYIVFRKPATEVSFRGRVGKSLSAQRVEIDRIGASQLNVLDPLSAGNDVEGDVQDVVGFMIGEMALEEMEVVVDITDQPDPPCQQQHGTDSPGVETLDAVGELIVDVARGDHRLFAFQPWSILDAVHDSLATLVQPTTVVIAGAFTGAFWRFPRYSGSHSKTSFVLNDEDVFLPLLFQNYRRFSSLFLDFPSVFFFLRLFEG